MTHLLVLALTFSAGERIMYVSLGGENQIARYAVNAEEKKVTRLEPVAVTGSPGCLALDPTGKFLYAALRSTGSIARFAIEQGGELRPLEERAVGDNPVYVATDRKGGVLFSAYYGAGKVCVQPLATDGSFLDVPPQWHETAVNAHAILADPSNRFVFVPHTGPNKVFQFRFDAKEKKLTPNEPAALEAPEGAGPRHLAFHPNGNVVYFSDELGSSVSACALDTKQGTLNSLQTLSTLPEGFDEKNTCADIETTPSGRFVYVSNRGHDSIAGFATTPSGDQLIPLGQTPTEETPRSFNIDPSGTHLYAAGQKSGTLAAYSIDPQSGVLERWATIPVGKQPSWVLVIDTPVD